MLNIAAVSLYRNCSTFQHEPQPLHMIILNFSWQTQNEMTTVLTVPAKLLINKAIGKLYVLEKRFLYLYIKSRNMV